MPLNTSLIFSQNVTSLNVTLEVVADSVVEEDEVLLAELVVPEGESGVSLRSSRVAITIINDDSNANIHTCDSRGVQPPLRWMPGLASILAPKKHLVPS